MPKKTRGTDVGTTADGNNDGQPSMIASAEAKVDEFAEDLGRLLGSARTKAEGWIGQRHAITQHLEEIRETATTLLAQLTGTSSAKKRGRPARAAAETPVGEFAPAPKSKMQRRKLSAKGRAAISAAQKTRWVKLRGSN